MLINYVIFPIPIYLILATSSPDFVTWSSILSGRFFFSVCVGLPHTHIHMSTLTTEACSIEPTHVNGGGKPGIGQGDLCGDVCCALLTISALQVCPTEWEVTYDIPGITFLPRRQPGEG